MRFKSIIGLMLLLPFLMGCNTSDDVLDIFTGKTWKLTVISDSKGKTDWHDYWGGDDAARQASMKLLDGENNFTITFAGVELESGNIEGTYGGRGVNDVLSGKWTANGKSNSFTTSDQATPGAKDNILEKAFIYALINAYKYEGDTNGYLKIYFKDEGYDRYLMFNVLKK